MKKRIVKPKPKPKPKTKKTIKKPDVLNDIAKYLEAYGWKVIVIGGVSVRQQINSFKYNYEFVVKFTGRKTP